MRMTKDIWGQNKSIWGLFFVLEKRFSTKLKHGGPYKEEDLDNDAVGEGLLSLVLSCDCRMIVLSWLALSLVLSCLCLMLSCLLLSLPCLRSPCLLSGDDEWWSCLVLPSLCSAFPLPQQSCPWLSCLHLSCSVFSLLPLYLSCVVSCDSSCVVFALCCLALSHLCFVFSAFAALLILPFIQQIRGRSLFDLRPPFFS